MPKLNKQEKEYAVKRIRDEIQAIISEEFGEMPKTLDIYDSISTAITDKVLKLKPSAEIIAMIKKNITSSRWNNSISIIDLVKEPAAYTASSKALADHMKKRNARFDELMDKAQPTIDEIQLGQVDAAKLGEIVSILKG